MTRRERKERRLQRRLEWAASRDRQSAAGFQRARSIADGIPLGQPVLVGHHSEKRHRRDLDRIDSGMRQGVESADMAAHHRAKGGGIADQLERSIFSDDPDAPERLRERIAGLEADRDRQKAINAEIRKGSGWEKRLMVAGIALTEEDKADLLAVARHQPYLADKRTGLPIFPSYHFQNLGGNIRRLRARLAQVDTIAAQRARVQVAMAAERSEPTTEEAP